jgi:hypothetical protein
MFVVIWRIVCSVGLPVQMLTLRGDSFGSQTLFTAFKIYSISSHTSSIVAVVWISIIKKRMFLEIIGNISEVDKKYNTHRKKKHT